MRQQSSQAAHLTVFVARTGISAAGSPEINGINRISRNAATALIDNVSNAVIRLRARKRFSVAQASALSCMASMRAWANHPAVLNALRYQIVGYEAHARC